MLLGYIRCADFLRLMSHETLILQVLLIVLSCETQFLAWYGLIAKALVRMTLVIRCNNGDIYSQLLMTYRHL